MVADCQVIYSVQTPSFLTRRLYIGGREVLAHEVLVGGECPQVKRLAVDVAVRARLVRVRVRVRVGVRVRVRLRARVRVRVKASVT